MDTRDTGRMIPAPESPDAAQVEMQPLDTIRYWLDAYTSPASGPHFMGHGMVVAMLREYLALRQTSADTTTRITAERDAALRDARRLRCAIDLPVLAYDAGDGVRIEAAKQRDGGVLWAIREASSTVLASDGLWEFEPQPSSRDADFLARCRYASPREALDVLAKARSAQERGNV